MKLFEKIPASFFSVLASPNRELYWTALVTLQHLLEYDLNIPVEDYCIALSDKLSDMELAAEDTLDEEEQQLIRQPNGKVRWIIHRLKRAGWLDTEYRDGTFEEVIAPRDYADQVIRLLLELEQSETKEYNSLVFSTYSGLKQAYEEKSDHMYEALLTARRNTAELLQDLKSLYHNIRYYHQIIGQAADVNQLLHDYYDEYKGMLDRIYHPIKTMDSLPHYRQPILDILNALLVDDEIMERAVGRMVQLHPDEDPAQARHTLDCYVQELLNSYSNVEDILRQIDRKHRAYTRESVDSIKYRMSADHSIAGKLTELLRALSEAAAGKQWEAMMDWMQKGIQCENQAFADGGSLWHPTVRSRRNGAPDRIVQDPSPEEERELLQTFRADRSRQHSIARAWQYLARMLDDREMVTSEELTLDKDDQFIWLLLAAVRSTDLNAPVSVEFLPGEIENNGYRIPRMRISRKRALNPTEGEDL